MAKKRPEKKESSRVNSSTALQRRFPSSGRDIRRQRVAARVRCVERRKWESVIVAFEHRRGDFPGKITGELLHKFVAGKLSRRKMRHCTDITNAPCFFFMHFDILQTLRRVMLQLAIKVILFCRFVEFSFSPSLPYRESLGNKLSHAR